MFAKIGLVLVSIFSAHAQEVPPETMKSLVENTNACYGENFVVRPSQLRTYLDRSLRVENQYGTVNFRIDADTLSMSRANHSATSNESNLETVFSVLDLIDNPEVLDIRLSFVEFHHKELLLWTETFENRPQKYGLFDLTEDGPNSLCQGELRLGLYGIEH